MTTRSTDAIQMLLSDHEKVRKLFNEYQSAGADRKRTLGPQILDELNAHSKIEEEIFYPAVREREDAEGKQMVAEGYEEHAVVDGLVMELKAMEPGTAQFDAKMKVLIENVEHHVQEEESELLPDAREKLGDETRRLGSEMEQRKQQLLGGRM
jgi:iron-sulfur cluster repair protein YtfE (RIC family)